MTATAAFLGPAPEAAAWRLAGALAITPAAGAEAAAFESACAQASLVLVARPVAAALPEPLLTAALARVAPLVLILPDGAPIPADPVERARRQLGVEL
jgi:vacuolar-type H+-ATPase subunit F/Vma7